MFGKVAGAERDRDEKRETQRAGFGFGIFLLLFFWGGGNFRFFGCWRVVVVALWGPVFRGTFVLCVVGVGIREERTTRMGFGWSVESYILFNPCLQWKCSSQSVF